MVRKKSKKIYPIFLPFSGCKFRCSFCNQWASSGVLPENFLSQVLESLEFLKSSKSVYDEVSIYGGTPIWSKLAWDIMEKLQILIDEGKIKGIRLSTRPDSITEQIAQRLKSLRVKTVELGIQSLSNKVLSCINRGHSIEDVERAIEVLNKFDIDVVGQFMIGLPCEGNEIYDIPIWSKQKGLVGVRIFPLIVLKGTEIEKLYLEKKYVPLSVDEAVYKLGIIVKKLEEYGIPVIQIGLHSSDILNSHVVAGPYLGNLGEMVRSFVHYLQVQEGKIHIDDVPISQRKMFKRWEEMVNSGNFG